MKYSFLIIFLFVVGLAMSASAVTCPDTTNYSIVGGVCIPSSTGLPDPSGGVKGVVTNLMSWLLGIFGFIGIIAFVIAGIYYLTAAGDAEQEKTAKKAMKMAIMGIVVGLAGYVIVQAVDLALRGSSTTF